MLQLGCKQNPKKWRCGRTSKQRAATEEWVKGGGGKAQGVFLREVGAHLEHLGQGYVYSRVLALERLVVQLTLHCPSPFVVAAGREQTN